MSDERHAKPEWLEDAEHLREWAQDVFLFADETLGMKPSEPMDELRGKVFEFTDPFGVKQQAMLFDVEGNLVYHDLTFYTIDMFKNQDRASFKAYGGTRFTWQQTVILTAYNRAVRTFGKDSYDEALRWLTARSGHGIGKTGAMSVIAIHFIWCFPGAQIGMTSNSEQQVEDIFMKEFGKWKAKLPEFMQESLIQTTDHVRVEDTEDWFLRAQVARPERPESVAGLHGEYILLLLDEMSAIADNVIETMKGALTGDCYIVAGFSNPTRNEGEFYESHKATSLWTRLHFTSRESPIVKPNFIERMEHDYPAIGERKSDQVLIRVDGEFAGIEEMDEDGWIPLFANINFHFEQQRYQVIKSPIVACDPSGRGSNRSVITVRDNIYLKEVLNEQTSDEKNLARKIETVRDAYGSSSNDVAVDAFGIGAKVVANITTKIGETVNALLTDKPREGTENDFGSFRDELAWKLRSWVGEGGIIITNNPQAWEKEMRSIKYKRVSPGRIKLMDKPTYKKIHKGVSPDRFDAAIYTFFKDAPSAQVILTPRQVQEADIASFLKRVADAEANKSPNPSSM